MRHLVVVTVAIVVALSCGTRKETPELRSPPPAFSIEGPSTGIVNTPLTYMGSYCTGTITWEVSGKDMDASGDEAVFTFDTVGTYLVTASCNAGIFSNQAISTAITEGGDNPVPVPEDPKPSPDPNKPNPVPTPNPIPDPNPVPSPNPPYPNPIPTPPYYPDPKNPIPTPKDPTQSEPPRWTPKCCWWWKCR
jgi:hypothetical protein